METITINNLKKGDYFKIVKKYGGLSKKVYVYNGYSRELKKYAYSDFCDISSEFYCNKNKVVSTDFIF